MVKQNDSIVILVADEAASQYPTQKAVLDTAANERGDAYIEGIGARIFFRESVGLSYVLYQIPDITEGWYQYFRMTGHIGEQL